MQRMKVVVCDDFPNFQHQFQFCSFNEIPSSRAVKIEVGAVYAVFQPIVFDSEAGEVIHSGRDNLWYIPVHCKSNGCSRLWEPFVEVKIVNRIVFATFVFSLKPVDFCLETVPFSERVGPIGLQLSNDTLSKSLHAVLGGHRQCTTNIYGREWIESFIWEFTEDMRMNSGHWKKETGIRGVVQNNKPNNLPRPVVTGRALSLALRLKNKKRGAAQTQIPKKVAISVNPGVPFGGGAPRNERLCLASCEIRAKWKNQRKWSAMTSTQEPMNEREVRVMRGQVFAKFCR